MEQNKKKKYYVHRMFNSIATKYDFLNHFLSLGMDFYWRFRSIRMLKLEKGNLVLDLASGTGDLSISALNKEDVTIVAADIAMNMLVTAQKKINKKKLSQKISFLCADGENLPFQDNVFDRAMIAFGIRNMEDIDKALRELCRTLKVGGLLLILEFSLPSRPFIKKLYLSYFKLLLPLLGRLISGHPDAYSYLPASVENFPSRQSFIVQMRNSGFDEITYKKFTFGICTAYIGVK